MIGHKLWFYLATKTRIRLQSFRSFESRLIVGSRQKVYDLLHSKGVMQDSFGEPHQIMMFMTFERCGVVARELESVLNSYLGYDAFQFCNLKGHYAVRSLCSGLVYDLVSCQGVTFKNIDQLDYAKYLDSKMSSKLEAEEFMSEYFKLHARIEGYK